MNVVWCFVLIYCILLHASLTLSQRKQEQQTPPQRAKLPLIDSKDEEDTKLDVLTPKKKVTISRERSYNHLCTLCGMMYQKSLNEFEESKKGKRFCVHLLQVQKCIKDIRNEGIKCSMFQIMFLKGLSNIQYRNNNCNRYNVSHDDHINVLHEKVDVGLNCQYQQKNTTLSQQMYCGIFGDPHMRTFFNVQQTCIIDGTWTLLNNEYIKIEVTNVLLQNTQASAATATNKVDILFKEFDLVCSEKKRYIATPHNISDTFQDGTSSTGPKSCQIRIQKHSHMYVSITSCRTNTTIKIRKVGKYLTFSINTPFEMVNKSNGLCINGCPKTELVDHTSFLKNSLTQPIRNENQAQAVDLCKKANLTDFYFDSCVFDILTTSDNHFWKAAKVAMYDAQNMDSKLRLRRENSVALQILSNSQHTPSSGVINSISYLLFYAIFSFYIFLSLR